ncbi:MAG: hypothetical protein LQ346_004389 [Caloplaca aetnensis]|nr:MAG: hypothetical protein LQ346_004389 [Caloplaca aetnensis]
MSSKRAVRDDKNRVKKRPQKSAPKASRLSVPSERYVYLATVEEYGPYREQSGPHIFEVYETLVNANERLRTYQQRISTGGKTHRSNYEAWRDGRGEWQGGWADSTDEHGCWHSVWEDEEREGEKYDVRRLLVRSKGSVPPPPPPPKEEKTWEETDSEEDEPEYWDRI